MTQPERPPKSYLGPVGAGFAILGVSIIVVYFIVLLAHAADFGPPG